MELTDLCFTKQEGVSIQPSASTVIGDIYLMDYILGFSDPLDDIPIPNRLVYNILESQYPLTDLPRHICEEFGATLPQGPDRRRLIFLFKCFPHLPASFAISICSPIKLTSPVMIQYAINFLRSNLSSNERDVQDYYCDWVNYLVARKKYKSFAYLLRNAPELFNRYYHPAFLDHAKTAFLLYSVAKDDPVSVLDFLLAHYPESSRPLNFLYSILSVPLCVSDLNRLIHACSCDARLAFEVLCAIGSSCRIEFENYSADHCAALYHQNVTILERLATFSIYESRIRTPNEHLRILNEVRYNPQYTSIQQHVASGAFETCTYSWHEQMLYASIYANKPAVFQPIREMKRWKVGWHLTLLKTIIRHPEFARLQLNFPSNTQDIYPCLLQVMYSEKAQCNQLVISEYRKGSDYTFLVLVAELRGKQVFERTIKYFIAKIWSLEKDVNYNIPILIDKLDNPVPFVNVILSNVDEKTANHVYFDECAIDKYLQAFLSNPANAEESFMVPESIQIKPSCKFITALLADPIMIAGIASERGRPVRERLHISLYGHYANLSGLHLLRLFVILQIYINDWSFSAEIDPARIDYFKSRKGCFVYAELVEEAGKTGFLSHWICWIFSTYSLSRFSKSVKAGEFNPLALPYWEVFALWHHTNHDNFHRFVPPNVYEAFARHSPKTG